MILKQAKEIALAICKKLDPCCLKIDIAGSVRREKPDVKDIEIVCQPRLIEVKDLFDNTSETKRSGTFILNVANLGQVLKGDIRTGRYVQILLPEQINLDLFIPMPAAYYLQFVVRTGSADYSHKVIANAWRKLGWVGTEDGLRLEKDCYKKDIGGGKNKWICVNTNPLLPPVWQSEEELFEWLKVPFVHPSKRYVNHI